MVHPQPLPDHIPDPIKFAPRAVSTLNEEDEDDESWKQTIRPIESVQSRLVAHSRQSSIDEKLAQPVPPSLTSPRGQAPHSRVAHGGAPSADHKAGTYGHHRQTSIVHGIQHSRNGSLASSTGSPLSPQVIGVAAGAFDRQDLQHAVARLEGESNYPSRPATALNMANPSPTSPYVLERTTSNVEISSMNPGARKQDGGQNRTRHGHSHKNSNPSRQDQKTVGEYALHVLFTSFIAQAEEKLNECITVPFEPEPDITQICGPGVDASFDQLIKALGHISSPKPKALIDSMMLWRKSKSDAANEARSQLQQSKGTAPGGPLVRRNTEPVSAGGTPGAAENGQANPVQASRQDHVAQAERRSTVSIYILCRVLIEVICQSKLSAITPEMEDKLETIIFGQLKIADPEQLGASPLKLANWNLFSELLGHMSGINFPGVTKRFIEDLDASLSDRHAKSPGLSSTRDVDGKVELVLSGMKHLRLSISPEDAWEQTCYFLTSLARSFNKSHGQRVKIAFCNIIDMLLLRIAAQASNNHLLHPRWSEVVANISPRLAQLFIKPRYWSVAFPLTATLLCVSSPDNFGPQWLQMILPLQTRVKDRFTKPLCLQVISRLVWTALYRTNDSYQASMRKLDDVMRLILPTSKRSIVAADTAVVEPLIQIIRIIGFKYPEYCFKNVIFPLINADLFSSNKDLRVDQLDPDRIVIGIRAFLCIMTDLEKGEQGVPPFPQFYEQPSSPLSQKLASSSIIALPPSTQVRPTSKSQEDMISRPVLTHVLGEGVREYYKKFCEVLGKITIVCDNTFGGQAALDEKFGSTGPKTPISDTFTFTRRDDQPGSGDQKQAFYELLHVAVQALPRCLSADIPFNSLVNLLCTGTAHVQQNIAESSNNSLKAIARQSHAQQVTMGFARFIFNFDDRYSTMSGGGLLGPDHIESTLRLYVELLQIWIEEIRQKTKDATAGDADGADISSPSKRAMKLDLSSIWAEVDQAEAHGLFFLCSQSKRVRNFAVTVLRLITEFDRAIGGEHPEEKEGSRLINVLENDSDSVLSFDDNQLSVAERSRLQRGLQNANGKGAVVELCTSEITYDATLWFKIFPNLIRVAFDKCPFTVTIGRDLVCNRILQMYSTITHLSEPTRGLYYGGETGNPRTASRSPNAQPEVLIEQWKLYLIFACTTLADPGPASGQDGHTRKPSKGGSFEKIVTARMLFKYLLPLLSVSSASVRDAVVVAMGSINVHIYRPLLEELQSSVTQCNEEARARLHQRTNSAPKRNRKMDLLRTEIAHVFKLTSHFLKEPEVYRTEYYLSTLAVYTKDLRLFLSDREVQMDWEFQKLRCHYCGLLEAFVEGINKTKDPMRWMTFESRKSAFSLMEDWCGFSPNQNQIRARETSMRQSVIDQQAANERQHLTAAMEIEKRNLRTAALSAMATLCAGPISFPTESGVTLQFDLRRMLAWIEAIFNSGSDRMNVIGRRALKNLVTHNQGLTILLEHCVARCYLAESSKVLESYFEVVTHFLLQEQGESALPFYKILGLCLFTLGNDGSEIRSKSLAVLKSLEALQQRNSKIQDLSISISDKTQAVYKLAQFEISKRLAKTHNSLAFHVFSEFSYYFRDLQPTAQRNIVAVVLPWIQSTDLKLDANGGPDAGSYVLLANLLELTIRSGGALHNEVQALWQALITGPHQGNARLVLDFLIQLCLNRREQNFVEYVKQIVVFLATASSTPGIKVFEFLLTQISPRSMVPGERKETAPPPTDVDQLPYCVDLGDVLPIGTKQAGYSPGQLALILLVDLVVSPVQLAQEHVPLLLQAVITFWDHYIPVVQEQAREMLVHLIHELILSQVDEGIHASKKQSIQALIDLIRRHDRSVVWSYEDSNGKVEEQDNKVPASMEFLTARIVSTFEIAYPGIKEEWGRLCLTWATSCSVRHLACRSFQIFRCVLTTMDQTMLGDMLARLCNTIADDDPEIQSFAMEILTTLKTLIIKLPSEKILTLPQLFWITCACLDSINEREFLEAVEMLREMLAKVDVRAPSSRRTLADGQPSNLEGPFDGVQSLLYKGLRSSLCWQPTIDMMDVLVQLPSDPLIGNDQRLFYCLLANFPRFLNDLERGPLTQAVTQTAQLLLREADAQGLESIAMTLHEVASGVLQNAGDLLGQLFTAIQEHYLPRHDFKMITFLMGLLTNSLSWVKIQTMRILCVALPDIDMRNPELAGHGSDLISPLLRLLQTEFCMEALEVLDKIMTMSGNHMDKHHLRMSMTRSTSKATRKEYEHTQSLFGIPESSGWAIPVPAKKTEATRANIHAVFYTCQGADDGTSAEPTPTTDVEFHADDYSYNYFQIPDRTETMLSDEVRVDLMPVDLITKLDTLDDFFDGPGSPSTEEDGHSSRTVTEYSPENFESGTQMYEQILPILHQASANNTSFSNGFADRSPALSREPGPPNTMTPGAFTTAMQPARPALHSRSITSPSAPASYQPQITADIGSDDEHAAGRMSESIEEEASDAWPLEMPKIAPSFQAPAQGGKGGGLRRLTSRSRDEKNSRPPPQNSRTNLFPPKQPQSDML